MIYKINKQLILESKIANSVYKKSKAMNEKLNAGDKDTIASENMRLREIRQKSIKESKTPINESFDSFDDNVNDKFTATLSDNAGLIGMTGITLGTTALAAAHQGKVNRKTK